MKKKEYTEQTEMKNNKNCDFDNCKNCNEIENNDSAIEDKEDDTDDNNELMGYDIAVFYNTYNIETLIRWIEEGKLIVPDFQRSYIWKLDQASAFIDSLLRGLPVPSMFFYDDRENKRMLVVDGQQRLLSLYKYIHDGKFNNKEFELIGNNVHNKWVKKSYNKLPVDYQRQLIDALLNITVMRQIGPDDGSTSMYLVFQRINTGGKSLTPQEVRMAVNYGDFAKYIDKISDDSVFNNWPFLTTGEDKKNGNNSKIQEFVLKVFAYYFKYVDNQENFSGNSLRSFLDSFFATQKNFDNPVKHLEGIKYHAKDEFEKVFLIIKKVVKSIDEKSFVTYDNKPVVSYAEAVLIGVIYYYNNCKKSIDINLIKKCVLKGKNKGGKTFKELFQPRRTSVALAKKRVEWAINYFEENLGA